MTPKQKRLPENTRKNTRKLPAAMEAKKWQKGQPSPNPGGRPKKRLIDELLSELLEAGDSVEALKIAKALIAKAKKGDSKASQLIAERTQGKPKQKVEVSGSDGGPISLVINFKKPNAK